MSFFVKFVGVKPSFRSQCAKKELFFQKIVFDIAKWLFNCFSLWFSFTLRLSIKNLVDLEKWKNRFPSVFAKQQLFQKVALFSDFIDEHCFLFKCGFEIAELSSFIVNWIWRWKTNVLDLNLRTDDLFRKLFSRQRVTNADLFSNMVCGLTQTFTLNCETKSEK